MRPPRTLTSHVQWRAVGDVDVLASQFSQPLPDESHALIAKLGRLAFAVVGHFRQISGDCATYDLSEPLRQCGDTFVCRLVAIEGVLVAFWRLPFILEKCYSLLSNLPFARPGRGVLHLHIREYIGNGFLERLGFFRVAVRHVYVGKVSECALNVLTRVHQLIARLGDTEVFLFVVPVAQSRFTD